MSDRALSMPEPICGEDAAYRYTWPGRNESFVCEAHARRIASVAHAMGLNLQFVPVPSEQGCCQQRVGR
jgi:hypothetical protein